MSDRYTAKAGDVLVVEEDDGVEFITIVSVDPPPATPGGDWWCRSKQRWRFADGSWSKDDDFIRPIRLGHDGTIGSFTPKWKMTLDEFLVFQILDP